MYWLIVSVVSAIAHTVASRDAAPLAWVSSSRDSFHIRAKLDPYTAISNATIHFCVQYNKLAGTSKISFPFFRSALDKLKSVTLNCYEAALFFSSIFTLHVLIMSSVEQCIPLGQSCQPGNNFMRCCTGTCDYSQQRCTSGGGGQVRGSWERKVKWWQQASFNSQITNNNNSNNNKICFTSHLIPKCGLRTLTAQFAFQKLL